MKWQSGKRVVYHDILFQNISKAVKKPIIFQQFGEKSFHCLPQFLSTVFTVIIIGHFLAHVREHWIYCLTRSRNVVSSIFERSFSASTFEFSKMNKYNAIDSYSYSFQMYLEYTNILKYRAPLFQNRCIT